MKIRPAIQDDTVRILEIERASLTAAHWSEKQYRQAIEREEDGPERLVLVAEMDDSLIQGREVKTPDLSLQKARRQGRDTLCCSSEKAQWDLAGFLVARHVREEWEFENIVVAPEFRGRGVGKQLLDEFIMHARRSQSRAVFLEVRESNVAARKLYQKAGFRETGRRKRYYADPAEDAVLYSTDIL